MLFPTVQFAIFFPIVLALSWALMPRPRLWKPFIVVASYVFYAAANWRFCLLLGGDHARQPGSRARLIDRDARTSAGASWIVGAAVALDLAVLAVFKYYAFFVAERRRTCSTTVGLGAAAAAADDRAAGRRQLLHVPGDLVRGRRQAAAGRAGEPARRRRLPQLLPAPRRRADRARAGVPAAAARRRATRSRVAVGSGIALIALGLVKKVVIADYLARTVVDPVFAVPQAYAGAGRLARRLRLHGADLLRLLRLHRHRDRARAADGLRVPAELPQPVPRHRASATSGGAGT